MSAGSPPPVRFSLRARLASFGPAFRGLASVLREQHNARIHAVATVGVVALGVGLGIDRGDWIAIALAIGLVWAAEALNSALEALCDVVSPERHPRIRVAKDAAAGGVLISALAAAVVGLLVFGPRLLA